MKGAIKSPISLKTGQNLSGQLYEDDGIIIAGFVPVIKNNIGVAFAAKNIRIVGASANRLEASRRKGI
jgi:hypothetical protein